MLQIVIQCDDDVSLRLTNSAQKGVVLSVVASEVDSADPSMLLGKALDDLPTVIEARIIDQYELVCGGQRWQHCVEALHQVRQ